MQAAKAEVQPALNQVHKRILRQAQMSSSTPPCTAQDRACSPVAHSSPQSSSELDSAAFKGFVEEVAARIIQTYWRKLQANRAFVPAELLLPRSSLMIPRSSSPTEEPFGCGVYGYAPASCSRFIGSKLHH